MEARIIMKVYKCNKNKKRGWGKKKKKAIWGWSGGAVVFALHVAHPVALGLLLAGSGTLGYQGSGWPHASKHPTL